MNNIMKYKIDLNKMNIFIIIEIIFMILSFYNIFLLSLWTIIISVIKPIKKKIEGAINALLLIQIRSILNPAIAVSYLNNAQLVKWVSIFYLSFIILYYCVRLKKCVVNKQIFKIIFMLIIYVTVLSFMSLYVSSFPLVALFKIISYIIPFISIIIGINMIESRKFLNKIVLVLGVILIGSIILVPSPIGYLRNGYSFQGFVNHPNIYAVLLVVFISGFLHINKELKPFCLFIIMICFFLISISLSRTAMISYVFILLLYVCTMKNKKINKFIIIFFSVLISSIIYIYNFESINKYVATYLYKGSSNILQSRENQTEQNLERFHINPIFGTGFNVPYIQGFKSYTFSFDLIVENGNLFLAILGDTGIIGFMLFLFVYGKINKVGKGILLFVSPILISMGEMSFFSTNNIGIFLYMYYAIYLDNGVRKYESSNGYKYIQSSSKTVSRQSYEINKQ